jgi:hypothetical protein
MASDLTILRALLDAGKEKLTSSEATSFRRLLEDLEGGTLISLSKSQREWVEGKYLHLKLDRAYIDKAPPKVRVKVAKTTFDWEKNKALKPPGKS